MFMTFDEKVMPAADLAVPVGRKILGWNRKLLTTASFACLPELAG
jgi:hypothetical protein